MPLPAMGASLSVSETSTGFGLFIVMNRGNAIPPSYRDGYKLSFHRKMAIIRYHTGSFAAFAEAAIILRIPGEL